MNANCREQGHRLAGPGTLGFSAVLLAMCLQAQGQLVQVSVDQGQYYPYQLLVLPSSAGDTAFDPTDGNRMYVAVDVTAANGGAIYRVDTLPGGAMALGDLVVQIDNPSSLAFTASGDLYVTQDYAGDISVIRTPRNGAPYTIEKVIEQFVGAGDDDPIAIGIAPAAFSGAVARPGDLIIADRGRDGDTPNDFYVYTPGSNPGEPGTPTDPQAFTNYLAPTPTLSAYDGVNINDFAFALDGASLYTLFANGTLVQLDPSGTILREASIAGASLTAPAALATHPVTGRIWVASDDLDEVWSIDPATDHLQRELKFARTGATVPATIDFNDPSIQFTSDGNLFTVSDAYTPGYVWVFKKATGTNHAPTVRIVTDPASGIMGNTTAVLDGSGSTNGDGGTAGLTYQWIQVWGPAPATIATPTSPVTTVTLPVKGSYAFTLQLDDHQATDNLAFATVFLTMPAVSVELPTGTTITKASAVFGNGGYPGDAAFDPTDNDTIYVCKDGTVAQGGGIYRINQNGDVYELGEKIAEGANPSSLDFTPDGALWWVHDLTPTLNRVASPRSGPPYIVDKVISSFVGSGDDDPVVVATAPPGFSSTLVSPGDVLIGDRGVDSNNPQGVYVFPPSLFTGTTFTGYSTFFLPTTALGAYGADDTNNLNGMSLGPDPARDNQIVMYLAFDKGKIAKFAADGTSLGEFTPVGVAPANLDSLGVNPRDGRIWIGDDNLDQLWSIDPVTGEAQLEVSFRREGESRPNYQINFHDPSIKFSRDGKKMVVCDTTENATEGWIWIFEFGEPFPFDWNKDKDVDGDDLTEFLKCVTGPAVPQTLQGCKRADVDKDGDVDQADFGVFQKCYAGAGRGYDPECVN